MDESKKAAIVLIAQTLREVAIGLEILGLGLVAKALESLAEQLEQIAND